jgi:hypothetical protein
MRANSKQAHGGAAVPADRSHDRVHHGIHRLAIALRAGVFAGVVRKKLGLKMSSEKTDRDRVYRITGGKPAANESGSVAAQLSA